MYIRQDLVDLSCFHVTIHAHPPLVDLFALRPNERIASLRRSNSLILQGLEGEASSNLLRLRAKRLFSHSLSFSCIFDVVLSWLDVDRLT